MLFFFFKQKTAYEMRISDWSSDVCSSDLEGDGEVSPRLAGLDPGYLHRQLDDYANGRREHEAMRTIALRLPEEDRRKVSAFYASLPAPAGPEAPPNLGGKRLYRVGDPARGLAACASRSEEHTSELQSLMRSSYAVFCLKKKKH